MDLPRACTSAVVAFGLAGCHLTPPAHPTCAQDPAAAAPEEPMPEEPMPEEPVAAAPLTPEEAKAEDERYVAYRSGKKYLIAGGALMGASIVPVGFALHYLIKDGDLKSGNTEVASDAEYDRLHKIYLRNAIVCLFVAALGFAGSSVLLRIGARRRFSMTTRLRPALGGLELRF